MFCVLMREYSSINPQPVFWPAATGIGLEPQGTQNIGAHSANWFQRMPLCKYILSCRINYPSNRRVRPGFASRFMPP